MKFELTADLMTGIEDIDNQHISIINWTKDLTSPITSQSPKFVRKVLKGMLDYVKYHFEADELAMVTHLFPDVEKHELQHRRLHQELVQLVDRANQSSQPDRALLTELQYFLMDWLRYHIIEWDKPLASHIRANRIPKEPQ